MTSRFAFLISDEERAMLEQLAERARRTAGDWMRQTIRDQHAAVFGAKRRGVDIVHGAAPKRRRPPKR